MKTRCVIFMMTILLVFCFSAFAESINVLVYPQNEDIESFISAFIPAVEADSEKLALVHERLQAATDKQLGEALAKAYKTEDEAKVNEAREAYENRMVKSLQSCPTLCDPIDGSPPGSPVPGILQARTLERVAISFSNA